ncbi:NfeD family protein [Actinoallomurus acaciae]|uniref:Nodulation protein NfeD n=1 Tax=Actinoallomurus acaciae TaxID=502577 RepID=A0ABV5YBJ5_9ACTN
MAARWTLLPQVWLPVVVWLVAVAWSALLPAAAGARPDTILTTRVEGAITPVVADHLKDGVRRAERENHRAFLVELDTPGGLLTSTREIVTSFLRARVPVVVYVAPTGSRAASAGTFITFAANVAAMAPGTTIGAATPVAIQNGKQAEGKIVEDSVAHIRSIAAQRGRNVAFAEDTVRRGRAATAEEALRLHAIDLIAPDRGALLRELDGRRVTVGGGQVVILHTAGARLVEHDMGLMRRFLQILADPNLAYLFLSIGTLAVIYELASPGMGLGGVIGAALLVLGLFSLSVLPVNVAGLALLGLAAALFVAEIFTPGIGVFAAGGAIALLLSGVFLFEGSIRVSPAVLWPTVIVVGGGALLAGRLAWRARRSTPATGREFLIGAEGVVRHAAGHSGQVFVEGAWWNARAPHHDLSEGRRVRVVSVEDLTLIVEPAEEELPKERP